MSYDGENGEDSTFFMDDGRGTIDHNVPPIRKKRMNEWYQRHNDPDSEFHPPPHWDKPLLPSSSDSESDSESSEIDEPPLKRQRKVTDKKKPSIPVAPLSPVPPSPSPSSKPKRKRKLTSKQNPNLPPPATPPSSIVMDSQPNTGSGSQSSLYSKSNTSPIKYKAKRKKTLFTIPNDRKPNRETYQINQEEQLIEKQSRLPALQHVHQYNKGLFTNRSFGKNEKIGEFVGDRYHSKHQYHKRIKLHPEASKYIIKINENEFIDQSNILKSNKLNFINHDIKNKNCYMFISKQHTSKQKIVELFAATELDPDTELLLDYGPEYNYDYEHMSTTAAATTTTVAATTATVAATTTTVAATTATVAATTTTVAATTATVAATTTTVAATTATVAATTTTVAATTSTFNNSSVFSSIKPKSIKTTQTKLNFQSTCAFDFTKSKQITNDSPISSSSSSSSRSNSISICSSKKTNFNFDNAEFDFTNTDSCDSYPDTDLDELYYVDYMNYINTETTQFLPAEPTRLFIEFKFIII
jgi:hypothetical protein